MQKIKSNLPFIVFSFLFISLNGLLVTMHFDEWYSIGVLKQTAGYPFGGEGPVPYYYRTPELYAMVMLIWGSLFSASSLLGVFAIFKWRKTGLVLAFSATFLLLIVLFAQAST